MTVDFSELKPGQLFKIRGGLNNQEYICLKLANDKAVNLNTYVVFGGSFRPSGERRIVELVSNHILVLKDLDRDHTV